MDLRQRHAVGLGKLQEVALNNGLGHDNGSEKGACQNAQQLLIAQRIAKAQPSARVQVQHKGHLVARQVAQVLVRVV